MISQVGFVFNYSILILYPYKHTIYEIINVDDAMVYIRNIFVHTIIIISSRNLNLIYVYNSQRIEHECIINQIKMINQLRRTLVTTIILNMNIIMNIQHNK